jgi:hypothetical protein
MNDDAEPEPMDSVGRRSVTRWIHKVLLPARRARHRALAHVKENPENRLIRTRLSGDDPYWWILAGGIHVPGFAATKTGEDTSPTGQP